MLSLYVKPLPLPHSPSPSHSLNRLALPRSPQIEKVLLLYLSQHAEVRVHNQFAKSGKRWVSNAQAQEIIEMALKERALRANKRSDPASTASMIIIDEVGTYAVCHSCIFLQTGLTHDHSRASPKSYIRPCRSRLR